MDSKESILSEERKQASLNDVRLNHLISCLGMRVLRLLFRDRYKTLTYMDWENGSVSLNEDFIKKEVTSLELTREEKDAVESADINNWNLTLLVNLLLSMGPRMSNSNRVEQNTEDNALKVLRNVRNYVDQVPGQGIQNGDFERQWLLARNALLRLGASEVEIDYCRTTSLFEGVESGAAAVVDPENEEKSKVLRIRAKELLDAGEVEGGIQLLTEALLLSGLSTTEKSCLYSSRCEAYLELQFTSDDEFQKNVDDAMEDAKLTVQLRPKWWKGHFLEGKCFRRQQLVEEAIDSLETALSLNPGSSEILSLRDVCRFMGSIRDDWNLDSIFIPDILAQVTESRDEALLVIKVNEEMMRARDPVARARGCLFIGNLFLRGEQLPLDDRRAKELFQVAAELGSPDGAYSVGICYLRGIGVIQNIPEAIKQLESAAKHKVRPSLKFVFDNASIAKAKAMLGTMYRYGVGKSRDYFKAAELFTRAALERNCTGALNLAAMLAFGVGIPRDLKRAFQYQKLAVELCALVNGGCPEDMRFLARLYADAGDLTKARYWYYRAINCGLYVDDCHRQHFENLLLLKQQELDGFKKDLPAHVLDSKVPIHILYARYLKRRSPERSEPNIQVDKGVVLPNSVSDSDKDSANAKVEPELLDEGQGTYSTCSPNLLDSLLEADPEEIEENRNLKLTDPKRIVAVKYCRNGFATWEADGMEGHVPGLPQIRFSNAFDGEDVQRAPSPQQIPTLKSIFFKDMDPTIDQVHVGRVINLIIMEELVDWIPGYIQSVVKDDNDDFNVICFYNFDRADPSTKNMLCFGSRIRLMNPYLVPQPTYPTVVRVDDPNSVVLVLSGNENPMCRYCWMPNPGPTCGKCKTAQYCNKECQTLDWEALGHNELCKVLLKNQKRSDINLESLKI